MLKKDEDDNLTNCVKYYIEFLREIFKVLLGVINGQICTQALHQLNFSSATSGCNLRSSKHLLRYLPSTKKVSWHVTNFELTITYLKQYYSRECVYIYIYTSTFSQKSYPRIQQFFISIITSRSITSNFMIIKNLQILYQKHELLCKLFNIKLYF